MTSALRRLILGLALAVLVTTSAWARSQHRGQVTFNESPVPGATVTATQGVTKVVAVTDMQGVYSFPDLTDGKWTVKVEMLGFTVLTREVEVAPNAMETKWQMKLLSLEQIRAKIRPEVRTAAAVAKAAEKPVQTASTPPAKPAASPVPALEPRSSEQDDQSERAADGLLINGSANNGAASPFSQAAGFGNNRFGGRNRYNGSLGFILDNSALDARPYSLAGQSTPKAAYNRMTGVFTLGGPLRIPRLLKNGPNFFIGYQWTRNDNSTVQSALMPSVEQRNGLFASPIVDPATGVPFAGNAIPLNRISPQAAALLKLFPLPNVAGNPRYNYEVPIVSATHQDALQSRFNRTVGRNNQVNGSFGLQSVRAGNPNVFGFLDGTSALGIDANANWLRRITNQWLMTVGYQYSRNSIRVTPHFQNRENISGLAGIAGNNQEPLNWGPPALVFSSGIATLSDGLSSSNHNQTSGFSYSMLWNRGAHNIAFGGDFRRRQFNYLSQQDPRGTFTFTGDTTGSDLASFLLGIPDTASIAYGNADKYFRQSLYDAYVADDWRINSALTLNLGVRWEYGAPITELQDRIVNLDVIEGFAAAAPVVASNPQGVLSGRKYPTSLVEPDKLGFAPRVGLAWKPVAGSSLVVRAGYGVYYDSSVYQSIALQMAQQPPLSVASNVQSSAANPLTLANGLNAAGSAARNSFGIDPGFKVGYAQNWQLSVQQNLPAALQLTGSYLGIKGTHGMQAFLPNTFPVGAVNPCPACPTGFVYLTSGGNSNRHAGQIQLRRRLRSGLAGSLQYTFSKSIDDMASMGGQGTPGGGQSGNSQTSVDAVRGGIANLAIAQDWRNLAAERGLSTFDQRHSLRLQMQYTTGMGLAGGTFLGGWKGGLFKDWTVATQITAGSGLPQTPTYFAAVPGTGVTGTIRPNYTGAPLYAGGGGQYLNPAAFAVPPPGQWGNARRGSIRGPAQFGLNASLARTFRLKDRFSLDLRIDATNLLNHVTYTAWVPTINSAQFGLPAATNAMRNVQTTMRVRF